MEQRGIVALDTSVICPPLGLQPFMYGDYIAYDCWLGKVYDLKNQIILKLSNGARCSMNTEDGAKLYDVCPHVSDSVCLLHTGKLGGGGAGLVFSALWAAWEGGRLKKSL